MLNLFKRSKDATTQNTSTAPAQEADSPWAENIRKAAGLAVRIAFIAFCAAMAFAVYQLGLKYGQPMEYRLLVAAGCAIGVLGHGAAVTHRDTNAGRMMHGISVAVWLVLSLFLASLYMFVSSPQLAKSLPDTMIDLGAYVYALAFGIGLFTSTLALVIPSVARRPTVDPKNPTIGSAVARFGEPLFLILCIGTSSLHLFDFGMNIAKVGLFSTIASMLIADLAFIVAEKRVLHELQERNKSGKEDRFDLVMWGAFGIAVLVYLVMVNAFAVRHTAGTLDMSDPMLKTTIDLYGISPTLLILSMAVLALITAFIDIRPGEKKAKADTGDRFLIRLAKKVDETRQDWGELRKALPSRQGQSDQEALPAPTPTVVMGSSGVDGAMDKINARGEFPSIKKISQETGMSEDEVAKAMFGQEDAGSGEPLNPKS